MASFPPALAVVDAVDTHAASNELVREHLPLVGHLVRELLTRLPGHVRRDELVSAGTLALVLSSRAFDESRGVPFARFAAIRIRGALVDELRSTDWASRGVRSNGRELDRVRDELSNALGRTPTRAEVAQAMGIGLAELSGLESDLHRASVVSLQALTTATDADPGPAAGVDPETLLVHREELGRLGSAIEALPERLGRIVRQYFFEQRKLAEIAVELGVTESRVSQLRSEALRKLRVLLQGDAVPVAGPTPSRCRVAAVPPRSDAVARRRPSAPTTTPAGEDVWALEATAS